MTDDYTETSGQLAREAGLTVQTVVKYANEGLLDCKRASNGTRLFRAGQAERVREIAAERVARKGRAA